MLFRKVSALVPCALLLGACGRPPDVVEPLEREMAAMDLPPHVECYRGRDGPVHVTGCDLSGQPELLWGFRRGWWLPRPERALRAKLRPIFGRAENPRMFAASQAARDEGSLIEPHVDAARDVKGWDIYDAGFRASMLVLDVDDRFALVYWQTDAPSWGPAFASLDRLPREGDLSVSKLRATYPCEPQSGNRAAPCDGAPAGACCE